MALLLRAVLRAQPLEPPTRPSALKPALAIGRKYVHMHLHQDPENYGKPPLALSAHLWFPKINLSCLCATAFRPCGYCPAGSPADASFRPDDRKRQPCRPPPLWRRTEEHTPEIQPIMRISYASFS